MKPTLKSSLEIAISSFAACAALANASPAEACQPPQGCYLPHIPLTAGAEVPSNLPGIAVRPAQEQRTGVLLHHDKWKIVGPDGSDVPASFHLDGLLVPKAPLRPGDYKIRYPQGCEATPTAEHAFKVGPAAPTHNPGVAGVTASVRTSVEPYLLGDGGCALLKIEKAAVARVRITPDAGLRPFLPAVKVGWEMDEQLNTSGPFMPSSTYGAMVDGSYELVFHANCTNQGPAGNLKPGPHKIWIKTTLFGAPGWSIPIGASFDLSCGEQEGDGGVVSDGGGDTTTDGGAPDATPPMNPPDAAPKKAEPDGNPPMTTPTPAAMSDEGGCSFGGGQGSAGDSALWAALAGLLVWRRRRPRG